MKAQDKAYRILTEGERRSMIALVATGKTQTEVAAQFGVHRNTVWSLCKTVKDVANSPLSTDWRKKLANEVVHDSVEAIHRSVKDTDDVHRAATTGLSVLKGLGHLQGDGVNVTVQAMLASMPDDMRERLVSTPAVEAEVILHNETQGTPSE